MEQGGLLQPSAAGAQWGSTLGVAAGGAAEPWVGCSGCSVPGGPCSGCPGLGLQSAWPQKKCLVQHCPCVLVWVWAATAQLTPGLGTSGCCLVAGRTSTAPHSPPARCPFTRIASSPAGITFPQPPVRDLRLQSPCFPFCLPPVLLAGGARSCHHPGGAARPLQGSLRVPRASPPLLPLQSLPPAPSHATLLLLLGPRKV